MIEGVCTKHGVVVRVWGNPAYVPRRCYLEKQNGDYCHRLLTLKEREDA